MPPPRRLPTVQVLDALKYLVRDAVLLNRLTARVKAAGREAAATPGAPPPTPGAPSSGGVDLDWFLTVMMQVRCFPMLPRSPHALPGGDAGGGDTRSSLHSAALSTPC